MPKSNKSITIIGAGSDGLIEISPLNLDFGTITVGYGLSIYILLPLSLLQMNYTLVLTVFLAILMGMLFGVTILVSNLQAILEIVLMYLLLFWE